MEKQDIIQLEGKMDQDRSTTPQQIAGEQEFDQTLRPRNFGDFVGQDKIKANVKIFIDAAKARQESLDHVLFYGPPGLGKTTLANIIAVSGSPVAKLL